MSDMRKIPASTRYGQLGNYWGNAVLSEGALAVYDHFAFEDEASIENVVKRVLVYPLDLSKRLYHYERVDRFNAPEPPHEEH